MADESSIGALDKIESILPDKTQDRSWFSKFGESLLESIVNVGTLGAVDLELSGKDMWGKDWGSGNVQPQGFEVGLPAGIGGLPGLLVPNVRFDLENRDVSLQGALPGIARTIDEKRAMESLRGKLSESIAESDSLIGDEPYQPQDPENPSIWMNPDTGQIVQTGSGDSSEGSPTVICTELHRQGLIPEEWYKVDQKVGQQFWHSDPEVMIGYLSWGIPVAKLMAKSKVVTFLAKGLALKWAQEMYAQECKPELSTFIGRVLYKYGPRICKFIGRRMLCPDPKEQ